MAELVATTAATVDVATTAPSRARAPTTFGVVADAAPGCSVLDARGGAPHPPSWALDVDAFDEAEFGLGPGDAVPDLSLDPDDGVLTLINASDAPRAYHVSVRDVSVVGRLGPLPSRVCGGRRCTATEWTSCPLVLILLCTSRGRRKQSNAANMNRNGARTAEIGSTPQVRRCRSRSAPGRPSFRRADTPRTGRGDAAAAT